MAKNRAARPMPVPNTNIVTRERTIKIPYGPVPPSAYLTQHVEVQLDGPQALALRSIIEGLQNAGPFRLKNGGLIKGGPDVFRWLLEQFEPEDYAGGR